MSAEQSTKDIVAVILAVGAVPGDSDARRSVLYHAGNMLAKLVREGDACPRVVRRHASDVLTALPDTYPMRRAREAIRGA